MNEKREIIKKIMDLSGSRSPYDIFNDWITCMALAIQNRVYLQHDDVWRKREEQYIKIIQPYGQDGEKTFAEMMVMVADGLTENMTDILGEIYMEAGLGNKNTGQFFTPFHVSLACARVSLAGVDTSKKISINEPSCGGGGMVIAVARTLLDQNINPQRCLNVVAQDLDWKAVYMCYVQLSLLGLKATVIQGDTLAEPYTPGRYRPESVFYTPARMGLLI